MKVRGITTTGADYWAHLFPESERLYWYPVQAMKSWLESKRPKTKLGRSLDESVTGEGYTIPKDAPFIVASKVPTRMLAEFDWARGTQRQRGMWGEEVLWWMLLCGHIRPPVWAVRRMETRREQFDIGDFELSFAPKPVFEIKTEGAQYANSLNLYVQIAEGGHKANLVRIDGQVLDRVTDLPPLRG